MKLFRSSIFASVLVALSSVLMACASVDNEGNIEYGSKIVKASGKVVSRNITNLKTFNSINSVSRIDVMVSQGNKQQVSVKGSDNLMKYINITSSNGTLKVNLTKEGQKLNFRKFDLVVYVTMRDIKNITSVGTGDIKFMTSVSASKLKVNLSGTGDIKVPTLTADVLSMNLSGTGDIKFGGKIKTADISLNGTGDITGTFDAAKNVRVSLNGTGDIKLAGTAGNVSYMLNGTGDIEAKDLQAKSVSASASGPGDIECYASDTFEGSNSIVSSIKCYGKPRNRNLRDKGIKFP